MEIEKKYLLTEKETPSWLERSVSKKEIVQGYLVIEDQKPEKIWRIRLTKDEEGEKAYWTFKQSTSNPMMRVEVESELPVEQAKMLLENCSRKIEKTRHIIPAENGLFFELDCFKGKLGGLFLMEIELPTLETEIPRIKGLSMGLDVTDDPIYRNDALARKMNTPEEIKGRLKLK
jgi:adenylate cyclase